MFIVSYTPQKKKASCAFPIYLVMSTENMRIVLLEFADTGETTQSTRGFVPVKDTKVCNSQRKLSVTTLSVSKEYKMPGTVHGLQRPFLLLNLESEHVVLVVGPVSRRFPDFRIKHVRCLDLLVATLFIL